MSFWSPPERPSSGSARSPAGSCHSIQPRDVRRGGRLHVQAREHCGVDRDQPLRPVGHLQSRWRGQSRTSLRTFRRSTIDGSTSNGTIEYVRPGWPGPVQPGDRFRACTCDRSRAGRAGRSSAARPRWVTAHKSSESTSVPEHAAQLSKHPSATALKIKLSGDTDDGLADVVAAQHPHQCSRSVLQAGRLVLEVADSSRPDPVRHVSTEVILQLVGEL